MNSIEADIELGGTDQLFNLMVGRDVQSHYGMESQQIALTVPLLEGLDGVALDLDEMKTQIDNNVKEAHRIFARELVRVYHGEDPIAHAEERYDYVAKGGIPDDVPEYAVAASELEDGTIWICKLATLTGLTESNGEARRLIKNSGIKLDRKTVQDMNLQVDVSEAKVLQRGKDKFVKVMIAS